MKSRNIDWDTGSTTVDYHHWSLVSSNAYSHKFVYHFPLWTCARGSILKVQPNIWSHLFPYRKKSSYTIKHWLISISKQNNYFDFSFITKPCFYQPKFLKQILKRNGNRNGILCRSNGPITRTFWEELALYTGNCILYRSSWNCPLKMTTKSAAGMKRVIEFF